MRHVIADEVLEEAADGGAPAVPCGCGVRPLGFDLVEKAGDRVGIQIDQLERGNAAMPAPRDKPSGDSLGGMNRGGASGFVCASTSASAASKTRTASR